MKKKIAILLLVMLLALNLTASVLAAPPDGMYIIDENGFVSFEPEPVTEPSDPVPFEEMVVPAIKGIRVVDEADLLNPAEQSILLHQLDEISQRQQVDIVVVTVKMTTVLERIMTESFCWSAWHSGIGGSPPPAMGSPPLQMRGLNIFQIVSCPN